MVACAPLEAPLETETAAPFTLAETDISRVTVYSDGAHVTRTAALSAPAGRSRVAFTDLPASVDPAALRVETSAGAIRSVETDWIDAPPPPLSEAELARVAIASLVEEQAELLGMRAGLEEELALLDALEPAPGVGPDGHPRLAPLRPDQFLHGLGIVRRRRADAVARLRAAEAELERLERKINREKKRLDLLGPTDDSERRRSVLVVVLDLERAGEVRIALTYLSRWATWRPYYELRLLPDQERIECLRLADLWQTTGEDWSSVELSLSTSEAIDGLWLPSVSPWVVESTKTFRDAAERIYEARLRGDDREGGGDRFAEYEEQFEEEGEWAAMTCAGAMRMRPPGGGSEEMGESTAADAVAVIRGRRPKRPGRLEPPPHDHPDRAAILGRRSPFDASGGFSHEIALRRTASVRSGHHRTRFALGGATFPAEVEYLLRPAVRTTAFGRARAVNPEAVPLLEGTAAIYVGDDFFGENRIESTPENGALTLDLGAETAIQAARRSRTKVRGAGLFSKDEVHHVEVSIDVVNHLGAHVAVVLEDQIPVSKDERVKVKLVACDLAGVEVDEKTGVLKGKLELDPAEKRTISFEYVIQLPRDLSADAQAMEVLR